MLQPVAIVNLAIRCLGKECTKYEFDYTLIPVHLFRFIPYLSAAPAIRVYVCTSIFLETKLGSDSFNISILPSGPRAQYPLLHSNEQLKRCHRASN